MGSLISLMYLLKESQMIQSAVLVSPLIEINTSSALQSLSKCFIVW